MRTLVIEKDALKNNITVIKKAVGRSYIYANLSADAYGAGAVEVAKVLRDEGIGRFAVDDAAVAVALRKAGLVDEEILMLRSLSDRKQLETLLDHNVVCSIGNLEAGVALNGLAADRATVAEAHIQVDCGTGFGGFAAEEPEKIFSIYDSMPNVAVAGVYTQVRSRQNVAGQLEQFAAVIHRLNETGYETGVVHAAGSYALLNYDMSHLDAVRAGSALLGRCRRERGDGLQTVGHGEVSVDAVRWLPKGHIVGGKRLRKATRVAIIPVGYQNGYGVLPPVNSLWSAIRRFYRNRRRTVRLGGQKVRVLGAIGGVETLLDVTQVKCNEGDRAVFDINPMFARGFKREYR